MKTTWSRLSVFVCQLMLLSLLDGALLAQEVSTAASVQSQTVPHLVKLSGAVKNADGMPRTGVTGITFALYQDQAGGTALWMETQNVTLDAQGRYTVLLGASRAEGMPAEVFSTNQARWLGIQPEGQAERRVLLVSVPYALKAADAETLGGMPASSFVLAAPPADSSSGSSGSPTGGTAGTGSGTTSSTGGISPNSTCTAGSCPVNTNSPGGTANFLPLFTDPTTVQNSILAQAPCPFNNALTCLGINTTTPLRALDVAGEVKVGGGNVFFQRDLSDQASRRNWALGTETFNVGDFSIFVSTTNTGYVSINPVFTALSNGFMGVGVATPATNLEVAGTGGGLLVDSPGVITGSGTGLKNVPAASLTGTLPAVVLAGVNGSGLTSLNAASLTGTLPAATLTGVNGSLLTNVNAATLGGNFPSAFATIVSNTFTGSQTINSAGTALTANGTGAGAIGLQASSNDVNGIGAVITNSAAGEILSVRDNTGFEVLHADAQGLILTTKADQYRFNNDTTTGTVVNKLATFTPQGNVIVTSAGAQGGAHGIVTAGAGTSGAAVVAIWGGAPCVFDNTAVNGDYVQISSTAAGQCHDAGSTYPTSGQVVGFVVNAGASPPNIRLFQTEVRGSGGGGTITAVNTAAGGGLMGGVTSGAANLSLINSCGSGQVLQWNGTAWACATVSAGAGVTSVMAGAGLTGSPSNPITSSGTLAIDPTVVPQLGAANTFSANQTFSGNNSTQIVSITQNGAGNGLVASTASTTSLTGAVVGTATGSGEVAGVAGFATGSNGAGVFGQASGSGGAAGVFNSIGSTEILVGWASGVDKFRVDATGKGFFDGGTQTGGADFAESLAVAGDRASYEPGDLLVIDPAGERRLALARRPYSTLVAGIYSTKPGVLATPHQIDDVRVSQEVPLAVVGVVPCKVTAENGPIAVGDLLVTSRTPGHAMKGSNRSRMLGAVVGKALEPLTSGKGVIQVLVTLQ